MSLLTLALVVGGCQGPREPSTSLSEAAFTGRAVCSECHAEENAEWRGSHHDLAMQPATEGTVLGDFDNATFDYNGVTSTFFKENGEFRVRTDGPDGQLATFPITHTFGVEPLQQYLVEFDGGRLQALSICWDTRPAEAGGQRWFHLYPGEAVDHRDVLHWTGLLQNWNQMCAECHSTDLHKNYDPLTNSYSTVFEEIDVSCEACHGPGSAHAAWASTETPSGDPRLLVDLSEPLNRWIPDPDTGLARRDPPRASQGEVESCARCHSRRSVLTDNYTYGLPLTATHRPALLTPGLYHPDGQINDEVYVYGSFLQSRMHAAGVSCSDCHNPHSLELRAQGNGLCAACHAPLTFDTPEHHHHSLDSAGAECIGCHMPEKNYMVVDPRRDHSFRVPRPDLSLALGVPDVCTGCHTDRSLAWATSTVLAWRKQPPPAHFAEALDAAATAPATAVGPLLQLVSDTELVPIVRATALEMLPRAPAQGVPGTLEKALADTSPLVRRAALGAISQVEPSARLRAAAPLLADPIMSVRIEAARILASVPQADWTGAQRALLEAALHEYRMAQEVALDRPEANMNLGLLAAELGSAEEAEAHYRRALTLSPYFVPGYVNLADLYRQLHRDAEAESLLTEGRERIPDSAELAHALGLALVRLQRHDEALPLLAQAVELSPDVARFWLVHITALHSRGHPNEAAARMGAALRLHGTDPDLLSLAMNLARESNRLEAALGYARRLQALFPEDVRVASVVRQLEAAAASPQDG